MKRLVITLFSLFLVCMPALDHAGASAAAYSGRLGELANRYMKQDGWQIDHYVQAQRHGARYLIDSLQGYPLQNY